MKQDELVNQLVTALDAQLFWLIWQFILIGAIILLLKIVIEALVAHLMFVIDAHVSIGTFIRVYGQEGYIKEVGVFTITIRTDEGFVRIPTKEWRSCKYTLLCKDVNFGRRKTDEEAKG